MQPVVAVDLGGTNLRAAFYVIRAALPHLRERGRGRIIAVVQNGYMLGDRVLRPAMVRVAQ